MAFTTTDRDALKRAIASGELSIRTNDRAVTYRSMDELKAALHLVEADLAAQSTGQHRYPRHQLADFSDD